MDILRQIVCYIIWFGVIPFCAGVPVSHLRHKREKSLGVTYLCGVFLMMSVFQLVAVPCVLLKKTLSELIVVYDLLMVAFTMIGMVTMIMGIVRSSLEEYFEWFRGRKYTVTDIVTWVVFFLLLALQMVLSARMMTTDGDDAYYLGHALIAQMQDVMYLKDPYTGGNGALQFRHVLAPFPMFIAMLSRKSGLPVAVFAHTVLPLFLIPMTYLVYAKIAGLLFKDSRDQVPVFMVLIALIQMFGNHSVYTRETFFLTRTWQGKSVLGNLVLPMIFFVILSISRKTENKKKGIAGDFVLLGLVNMTGALTSSLSLLLCLILEGVLLLTVALKERKPQLLLWGLIGMLPCFFYGGLYAISR